MTSRKKKDGPTVRIDGSVVLISGANRGIGKAMAEEFLKAGAAKIYLGVRDVDSVRSLVATNPKKLVALQLDVTNQNHIRAAAEIAKDVTILINNAGVLCTGGLQDQNRIDCARKEMEVNYFGPMSMIKSFAPILKANGGGAIANVSSIAGMVAFPGIPTYCASKAALHFLTLEARLELASQHTHVLGIYPGPVDTDMTRGFEMPKVSPNLVAREVIRSLELGDKTLLPDPYSQELYLLLRKGPKFAANKVRESFAPVVKSSIAAA